MIIRPTILFGYSLVALNMLIAPNAAKAEGGCPSGLVPVGGGYCRNIVCPKVTGNGVDWSKRDESTKPYMKKYNLRCPIVEYGMWGNMMVPMR